MLLQPHRHPAPAIQKETLNARKSRATFLSLPEIEDLISSVESNAAQLVCREPHEQIRVGKSVKLSSIPSTSEMVRLLG